MSQEALIDYGGDLNVKVSGIVGECKAVVTELRPENYKAQVNPSFEKCQVCKLSEYCTRSIAE